MTVAHRLTVFFFDFLKVLLTTTESDSDDNVNRHDSDSREEFDRINDVFSPDIGDRSSLVKAGIQIMIIIAAEMSWTTKIGMTRAQKGGGAVGVCHKDMKLDGDGKCWRN